jgi:hypothetical protein
MLSFMASQAVALSQARLEPKRSPKRSPVSGHHNPARRSGKGFFSSVFDALVETRMRRAEIEIEHHRRFYGGYSK